MRRISVPEALRLVDGPDDVVSALASLIPAGRGRLLVVSTPTPFAVIGQRLCQELGADSMLVNGNTYAEVQRVAEYLFLHDDAAVAGVGGGKAIDVAKLGAHYARRRFISIPTQVSHDGVASPIAVISHPSSGVTSIGATAPEAIIVPMATVLGAPERTILAGVGDLMGKLTALHDWRLAVGAGGERFDDYAAILAEASVAYVYPYLSEADAEGPRHRDQVFVSSLIRGLILSGIAMMIAGSSRPCSGSEHLISHAIDSLFGGRALHGEQVAVGTVAALAIQGKEAEARRVACMYRRLGLPARPSDIGLSDEDFLAVLGEAPRTRPGRYTVLDHVARAGTAPEDILSVLKEAVWDA